MARPVALEWDGSVILVMFQSSQWDQAEARLQLKMHSSSTHSPALSLPCIPAESTPSVNHWHENPHLQALLQGKPT